MWLRIISFYLMVLFASFSFISFAAGPDSGNASFSLAAQGKGEMAGVLKTAGK
jgi:hypothetical protein